MAREDEFGENEIELDDFGRDAHGRIPADRARPGDNPDDIIPAAPRFRPDGERWVDADAGLTEEDAESLAATADLDEEPLLLIPDGPPLPLQRVEELLDTRRNEVQISPTLDRISALVDLLGNPQDAAPVIQIAGTNGKTSVSRMIDALLTRLGVRTGRFTSPHLQSVTERISIDGSPIDEDAYVAAFTDIAPFVDLVDKASATEGGMPLSKFEILTAMAYAAFADAPVEAAVIEVGLGGTWDSTSVATPRISVVTPISLDHTDFLGDTLPEIAGNKAGIIKPGSIAIIGRQDPEALDVLLRRAVEVDATVARFGAEFTVLERAFAVGGQRLTLQGLGGPYEDIFLPLAGEHQAENAALALAAVEAFFGAGAGRQLDLEAVQDAFASVASPGRLERIRTSPTILIDAAHNVGGAKALAAALAGEFGFDRLVGVLAVLGDKDVKGMLEALSGSFDQVVLTENSSPRSLPLGTLADLAIEIFGESRVHTADGLPEAIARAVELAQDDAENPDSGVGVVVTGSVVTAGDARALAGLEPA